MCANVNNASKRKKKREKRLYNDIVIKKIYLDIYYTLKCFELTDNWNGLILINT